LDLDAIPPFKYAREHFGYRDRITTPEIEGTGFEPTPGSGPPIKAGEFILGYPDEDGPAPKLPQPEVLSRNGSYMAYRRLHQHVGAFREFLREQGGPAAYDQELIAAKLMGRWRSGAPLVLTPDKDDPSLADDPRRNNKLQLCEDGSPRLRCAAGRTYPPDESTRHGREYKSPQGASPWRDIRAAFA
jgi:deferrochelatase/peroxidase EfeB